MMAARLPDLSSDCYKEAGSERKTMKRLRLICLIMAACAPQLASAQQNDVLCDDTSRLKDQLMSVIGATQHGSGLRDPESMLEIWIVPETGDWTVVQTYANGTSCIMAMGEHWQAEMQEPA